MNFPAFFRVNVILKEICFIFRENWHDMLIISNHKM